MAKEKELKTKGKAKEVKAKDKKNKEEKKNLWVRFRIYLHGIRTEFEKVHWTPKKDMIRYSIATIVFIIFFSVFFYVINLLFALIQSLV